MIKITDEEIEFLKAKYGQFKNTKIGELILRLVAAYEEAKGKKK